MRVQDRVLLAALDGLTVKAVESVGKRLVRADRSNYRKLNGRPFTAAHTVFEADEASVRKALRGAWDQVPEIVERHGKACGVKAPQVVSALDAFVVDLCLAGRPYRYMMLEDMYFAVLDFEDKEEGS